MRGGGNSGKEETSLKTNRKNKTTQIRKSSNIEPALAGGAQWIEHWHGTQRVAGLTRSQSTCLDCGPGPQ